MRVIAIIVVCAAAGLLIAAFAPGRAVTSADPVTQNGARLIENNGCGTCHSIPGINGADGVVGPPLDNIGRRVYLAGILRNTPENMASWLQHPQAYVPGNAMPEMGLTGNEAKAITAYLRTLQ
jgi:cytochrome c2